MAAGLARGGSARESRVEEFGAMRLSLHRCALDPRRPCLRALFCWGASCRASGRNSTLGESEFGAGRNDRIRRAVLRDSGERQCVQRFTSRVAAYGLHLGVTSDGLSLRSCLHGFKDLLCLTLSGTVQTYSVWKPCPENLGARCCSAELPCYKPPEQMHVYRYWHMCNQLSRVCMYQCV